MISRQHRFHGYGSLKFVYKKGSVVRGQYIAVRYASNARRKTYRAAVVVSRKVHKSAVVRNRIRRRLYEIIRLQVPSSVTSDIVINVFSDQIATLPADKLQQIVASQLRQAGIKI